MSTVPPSATEEYLNKDWEARLYSDFDAPMSHKDVAAFVRSMLRRTPSHVEALKGETPRTDAAIFNAYDEEGDALPAVDPEHARQLERDLAVAKADASKQFARLLEAEEKIGELQTPASSIGALIKRDDVVYLITHQRTALLEAAERPEVKSHHADVLRDMAGWWQDLSDAVKKLKDHAPLSAIKEPNDG